MRRVTVLRHGEGGRLHARAQPRRVPLPLTRGNRAAALQLRPASDSDAAVSALPPAGATAGIGVRFTKAVNGPCKIVSIAPGVRAHAGASHAAA